MGYGPTLISFAKQTNTDRFPATSSVLQSRLGRVELEELAQEILEVAETVGHEGPILSDVSSIALGRYSKASISWCPARCEPCMPAAL